MPLANRIASVRASRAQPFRLARNPARGFTLVEILTATAIMSLIISLVMVILTQTMTAWNDSSEELTFSTNARAVFDLMAQDLQGCILRSDGNQWLSLTTDTTPVGSPIPNVNDSRFIFFTSTPLHMMKDFGTPGAVGKEIAGDICTVEYRVTYADPFGAVSPPGSTTTTKTFSLHRVVIDPASTFFGVNGIPIMGLGANTPATPGLAASFDASIDVQSPAAALAPTVNDTPVPVAIPYGGSTGPSPLALPVYGAYSTANRLLDNVGQFTVFLYFIGQNANDDVLPIQAYPQTPGQYVNAPSVYYGGAPGNQPSSNPDYLDGENGTGQPPISFLSLAYADVTLSILTDEGVGYLQQNNGAVPQGFTWPQFLQKFSKTYTQRIPVLAAPH